MLFGPLLVFTPERKIIVRNRILRAVVAGAQAKETRYVSFAIFLVILATKACRTPLMYARIHYYRMSGGGDLLAFTGAHQSVPTTGLSWQFLFVKGY